MSERMQMLTEIRKRKSTHACPSCSRPTYCSMDDGKSSSTCWCTSVPPARAVPDAVDNVRCLCKACLLEELQ